MEMCVTFCNLINVCSIPEALEIYENHLSMVVLCAPDAVLDLAAKNPVLLLVFTDQSGLIIDFKENKTYSITEEYEKTAFALSVKMHPDKFTRYSPRELLDEIKKPVPGIG